MAFKKEQPKLQSDFKQISIGLASPEQILEWSNGEVTKPETINYRTFKPEMGGLFCERIFGPTKDYECWCGKYKRIRYKGIVCDRCGVEVTEKRVRRERLGHVNLVVPVAHIWYFKSLPNKIGYLLGLPAKKLELIIYYERYIVIQPGIKEQDGIAHLDFLTEEDYLTIQENLPKENRQLDDTDPNKFIAKMGGEALIDLLNRLDLDDLSYALRDQASKETSQQRKTEALKRLKVIEGFRSAQERFPNNPEWMIVKVLPVIPPELRPLVPLDGGRFASSDLNDLYRRVIIRNNRLKRLMEIKAPEVILRNEKRMLQEAVDSLFDNSRKANAVKTEGNRPLKSLSDMLKGKQGRFRQNLLGKRVDYSGRSVIVVGPRMKMHECGLPKNMAAELFKPFIIRKLIERGVVKTVKSAKKIVDRKDAVIWEILEYVMKGHPVLLNRAPTLHRLGIQSFQPKLVEGKAIQLHPLVCTGFNADFDGDQMAIHVPLGNAAVLEAQLLMLASHNILNPANGNPIVVPSQDMVLGLYYLTKERPSSPDYPIHGEGRIFANPDDVHIAYDHDQVHLNAGIKVRVQVRDSRTHELSYQRIDTTVGRVLFNEMVPEEVGYINELLSKKSLRKIIALIYHRTGLDRTAQFLDDIKELGFYYSFKGGLSFNLSDVSVPDQKLALIAEAQKEVDEITENYNMGFITNNERYNQVIDIWTRITNRVTDQLLTDLSNDEDGFNSVYMMLDSGARGSKEQIRQLGGMRGLMAKPRKHVGGGTSGEIIENPIIANFKEGLSVLEYFISTHGARKGLADTALKTADAGYLTRRLHDVAQDVVVREEDCGTLRGIEVTALKDNEEEVESLYERILGRCALHDIYHPITQELLVEAGALITENLAAGVEDSPIDLTEIRSVLTCETINGVCEKCYGRNLATGRPVQKGEAVGVIAAQSIGEPGTQLTLRTFHVGGTASKIAAESTIFSRFEGKLEFEGVRTVTVKGDDGDVEVVLGRSGEIRTIDMHTGALLATNHIPYGSNLYVEEGQHIKKGEKICAWDPYNAVILGEFAGKIEFENIIESITFREEVDDQTGHREKVISESRDKTKIPTIKIMSGEEVLREYNLPLGAHIIVEEGADINQGQILVKIPRATSKTRDITGGLPRVTELFEARNPSNPAVISAIDGIVSFGNIKRGNREIKVTSKDGETKKYLVNLSKHILVQENDFIRAGEPLSDGATAPADILAISGPFAVQQYILNGIQEVYRLQGVKINDKHIEIIVRQMMQKVMIQNSGDTRFLEKDAVDKWMVDEENEWIFDKKVVTDTGDSPRFKAGQIISTRELREENSILRRKDLKLAEAREAISATTTPMLQGITRASLGTQSFLSAASFQETTKVLNEAAIHGKVDTLNGLKENVIVGHRIPAGTGLRDYEEILVGSSEEAVELELAKEAAE